MTNRHTPRRVLLALVACVLLLPAGSGRRAAGENPPEPDVAAIRSDLQAQIAGVGALRAALAPADVDTISAQLGGDSDRVCRYVRDGIALDPYAGILRGPNGTLRSRAGSSWDRALLLATLLRAAGKQVRFARATLPPEMVARLLDRALTPVPARPESGAEAAIAQLSGLDPASAAWRDLQAEASRACGAVRTELTAVRDRALQQNLATLTEGFGGETIAASPFRAAAEAALADHLWVEVAQGKNWQGLDPALPELEPGATLCPAQETFVDLPADRIQRVSLRLEAEWRTGADLRVDELLSFTSPAFELDRVPIFLGFEAAGRGIPPVGPERFVPVLQVGGKRIAGVRGVLEETSDGSQLTAVRLCVETAEPGRPAYTSVHPFRELEDPAATSGDAAGVLAVRRKDAPDHPVLASLLCSISVLTAPVDAASIAADDVRDLERDLRRRLGSLPGTDSKVNPVDRGLGTAAAALTSVHTLNLAFHALREDGLRAHLPPRAREFSPAARVSILAGGPVSGRGRDRSGFRWSYDLAVMPARVLSAAPEPSALGVLLGALDQATERIYLEYVVRRGLPTEGGPDRAEFSDVSGVFEAAARQGVTLLKIEPGRPDLVASLDLSDGVKARWTEYLSRGCILLVPARRVEEDGRVLVGCWRFDPTTGVVRDETGDGRHGGDEYVTITERVAFRAMTWINKYGSCIKAGAFLAGFAVTACLEPGSRAQVAMATLLTTKTVNAMVDLVNCITSRGGDIASAARQARERLSMWSKGFRFPEFTTPGGETIQYLVIQGRTVAKFLIKNDTWVQVW